MTNSRPINFGGRVLDLAKIHVMGILNITPDSFSDGGELLRSGQVDIDKTLLRAEQMVLSGARFLDVGGESTRPGAQMVAAEEELDRVAKVVELLVQRFDVVVSVDTSNPHVMRACAGLGAGMINDIRALARPGAMQALADSGLPVCLMHIKGEPSTMQNSPQFDDVVTDVMQYFEHRIAECCAAGIKLDRLLLDPGFGFGKTLSHNLQLLNSLEQFSALELPILVGLSRKRMLGEITGKLAKDRGVAGVAAAVIAVMKGASIVRTHDVAETVDALKVCQHVRD